MLRSLTIVEKQYVINGEKVKVDISDGAISRFCDFKHGDNAVSLMGRNKCTIIGIYKDVLFVSISCEFGEIIPFSDPRYLTKLKDVTIPVYKIYETFGPSRILDISCEALFIFGFKHNDRIKNSYTGHHGLIAGTTFISGKARLFILYDINEKAGIVSMCYNLNDLEVIKDKV